MKGSTDAIPTSSMIPMNTIAPARMASFTRSRRLSRDSTLLSVFTSGMSSEYFQVAHREIEVRFPEDYVRHGVSHLPVVQYSRGERWTNSRDSVETGCPEGRLGRSSTRGTGDNHIGIEVVHNRPEAECSLIRRDR